MRVWVTSTEAARVLGISRTTMHRYIVGGMFEHLPNAVRFVGKSRQVRLHLPTILANGVTTDAAK